MFCDLLKSRHSRPFYFGGLLLFLESGSGLISFVEHDQGKWGAGKAVANGT